MSRTGEYFLEIQEQERHDWICAQLDDDEQTKIRLDGLS